MTADDPDTLDALIDDVAGWTEKHVRWAVASPSADQDRAAAMLVPALLATPSIIERAAVPALGRDRSPAGLSPVRPR